MSITPREALRLIREEAATLEASDDRDLRDRLSHHGHPESRIISTCDEALYCPTCQNTGLHPPGHPDGLGCWDCDTTPTPE